MKKVIAITLVIVLVLSAFSLVFANDITPYYIGTANHVENLNILSNGKATFSALLTPKTSTTFDRVNITLELVYEDDGSTVYKSISNTTYEAVVSGFRKGVTDYQLDDRGDYRLFVTYKCYSGSTLVETINSAVTDTY